MSDRLNNGLRSSPVEATMRAHNKPSIPPVVWHWTRLARILEKLPKKSTLTLSFETEPNTQHYPDRSPWHSKSRRRCFLTR